jgi:LEA14-like dessication related protein
VLRAVVRVAVVVAIAASLSACPSFEKPSLSVEGAKIASVDFDGAVVDLTVELSNPNKIPLLADRLAFDGFIEGKPLVHSTLKQRVTVPAEGKATVKVPLRFVYKELKGALASLEGKKRWDYEVKGEIGFEPHEKLTIALPFAKGGELPAPQLPTVKAGEPRLENVSLQGLTVVADVTVTNPNAFALPAGSLGGSLKVGSVTTPIVLSVPGTPSEKTQKVTLRQQVSLLKAASVGVDLMAGRSVKADLDVALAFGERKQPLKASLTLKR